MKYGVFGAIFWALGTVISSIALSNVAFMATPAIIASAAFISAFLHDASSAVYMFSYMGIRRRIGDTIQSLKTKPGRYVILAAILGGPLGMSGYMIAINNIGPSYTAAISAFYPAVGALFSCIFLKEKMKVHQWVGLFVCLAAVAVFGYTPASDIPGSWLIGILSALVCVAGWALEAVIVSYGFRSGEVDNEIALHIRQTTSAVVYAAIILPVFGAWEPTVQIIGTNAFWIAVLAGAAGTISYIFYYKGISKIGAARGMAINITYSAWAIPISLVLVGTMPDVRGVICALAIFTGAVFAATPNIRDLLPDSKAKS